LVLFASLSIITNYYLPLSGALDELMNLNLWKQKGCISLWRYDPINKNFPGWHMNADKVGYESLLEFLHLLEQSPVGSKRTIKLVNPDIWSASSMLKKTPEQKVLISLAGTNEEWRLKNEQDKLLFSIGAQQISVFKTGIMAALKGEYDFSVGAIDGQNIWFW